MSNQLVESDRLDFQRGVKDEPLTDRDIQLIHRYLSDPAVFPREFKNWVTNHSSDTVDISKSQVHGLINATGQVVIGGSSMEMLGGVLCGVCLPYAAPVAPDGWLLCNGQEYLRTEYSALWNKLGTLWGTPSAGDKFKVPDFRGRAPFGQDSNVAFAGNEGAAAGARGPKHYHRVYDSRNITISGNTGNDAVNHTHAIGGGVGTAVGGQQAWGPGGGVATSGIIENHYHPFSGTATHTIDVNTYAASGPAEQPGWVGLIYIIGSGKVP